MVRRFFLLTPLAVTLGSCTLFLAGDPNLRLCDLDNDCPDGDDCTGGFCVPGEGVALVGEGEGEGEGEEGEGDEGEGDEGQGDEGEGDEGEGEGDEGEGEGEPPPPPPTSCAASLAAGNAAAGPVAIDLNADGDVDDAGEGAVFCDNAREGGGWTRVGFFDQANLSCPAGLVVQNVGGGLAGCSRPAGAGSQVSISLAPPQAFTQVMGHLEGVVFGDQDAFASHVANLDGIYVDGVSITVGAPREHVFTFVAAHPCYDGTVRCPCDGGTAAPAFVDAFFCDNPSQAARPAGCGSNVRAFDPATPLWDGPTDQCIAGGDGDGFFVKSVGARAASSLLEARLMTDQDSNDENLVLTRFELYVR